MLKKKIISTFFALIAANASAENEVSYSWNLSRDMMSGISTNPFGLGRIWTAMYDDAGTSHNDFYYKIMPSYNAKYLNYSFPVWANTIVPSFLVGVPTKSFYYIGFTLIKGMPVLHPSPTLSTIIRWKSPINGKVSISGGIADADPACGDGVDWFVDKGKYTLMSGTLPNGNSGQSILQQNIPVSVGSMIYFIVSPKNDPFCDTTYLDVIITSP